MASLDDLLALVQAIQRDTPTQPVSEGVVASGSWDAAEATVQHIFGETAAISPDEDNDQPLSVDKMLVATTGIGDQYAPVGNERTVAIPTPSGHVLLFVHGPDDTPQAPSGERWIVHYNAAGQVDAFIKHTNDGPTTGDGLGGAHYGGNAALTQATTKSGHSLKMDDTAKAVTTQSAGGHSVKLDDSAKTVTMQTTNGLLHKLDDAAQQITHVAGTVKTTLDAQAQKLTHAIGSVTTIVDGAGNAISHVASAVGLGDLASNLTAVNAAMRNADLSTFEDSLHAQRLSDLENLATAVSQALATASPAVTVSASSIIALIASLAHISVPSGSSVVKIK